MTKKLKKETVVKVNATVTADPGIAASLSAGPTIEALLNGPAGDALPPEEEIEKIAGDLAITEAKHKFYADIEADRTDSQSDADKPSTDEDAKPPVTPISAKPAKVKKERKPKAEKAPAAPRVHFHSHKKSEVLLHKLGGNRDVLNLELADFALDAAAQTAKQAELLAVLDEGAAKKVSEKAIMLLTGKAAEQEVLKRTFTVLARDGYLTSGSKGNLQTDLLTKYTSGTAASQANQMFMLLPTLRVTNKEKGRMTPNRNSTVLAAVLGDLGLVMKASA